MSPVIPLESLRIAKATTDIMDQNRGRIAMAFGHWLSRQCDSETLSSSDAVLLAGELIGAARAIAVELSASDIAQASLLLAIVHRGLSGAHLAKGFREMCEQSGISPMVGNAWGDLIRSYVRALDVCTYKRMLAEI